MLQYKLSVVDKRTMQPDGAKYPVANYHEEYVIGYFGKETSLLKWAKENDGELAKSEFKEEV